MHNEVLCVDTEILAKISRRKIVIAWFSHRAMLSPSCSKAAFDYRTRTCQSQNMPLAHATVIVHDEISKKNIKMTQWLFRYNWKEERESVIKRRKFSRKRLSIQQK